MRRPTWEARSSARRSAWDRRGRTSIVRAATTATLIDTGVTSEKHRCSRTARWRLGPVGRATTPAGGSTVMGPRRATARKLVLVVGAAALGLATLAAPAATAARVAGPSGGVPVRFERLAGFAAPGTPAKYDRVAVLETGSSSAKNILVLVPGTSASAAYFEPLAKDIARQTPGWQVWAVRRRGHPL